jgi:hypothetical protein
MTPPHGGARKGAGRPREPDHRVTLAVRVEQVTRRDVEYYADEWGMSMGEALDYIVERFGAAKNERGPA